MHSLKIFQCLNDMIMQELILKLQSVPHVSGCLDFMQTYSFLPIEKNFVEFSQDAYYAKFNAIVGIEKHYFLLPEVTEDWPVKKIIVSLEEGLKSPSAASQKVLYVTGESKERLLEVADLMREICRDKSFSSPLETIAFVRELIYM